MSLRIYLQDYIIDEVAHQIQLDQLLLLDEIWVNALEHMCTYQNCIKRAKINEFNTGYLVLNKNQQNS